MKRFTKGQTVYLASTHFADNATRGKVATKRELRVISRTVDSCGAKQITFEDHGHDSTFGRQTWATNERYHATPEAAFAYLESVVAGKGDRDTAEYIINREVISDRVWVPSII